MVHGNHDHPQLGKVEAGKTTGPGKAISHGSRSRPSVHSQDHRVFFLRVKVGGQDPERRKHGPIRGGDPDQFGTIQFQTGHRRCAGISQCTQNPSGCRAENHPCRLIHSGITVQEHAAIGRWRYGMAARLRGQELEFSFSQGKSIHPCHGTGFPGCGNQEIPARTVHMGNRFHCPLTCCQGPHMPRGIHMIDVMPSAGGGPDHEASIPQNNHVPGAEKFHP